ncbi:unnamed protein product [Acanthoscelides obtectus]|uniref:Uncharacterized protein n=1 Tax=Acanthoscelides obtectus TaxID=200917 RepID=A0A9P0LV80_ACAOB|nr:unnamed protein product [Acanthoscelides obtectus]CAK1629437.1 hypothetical protein AOBTE_LOCUS5745 [Acanthoscelides obtectus]
MVMFDDALEPKTTMQAESIDVLRKDTSIMTYKNNGTDSIEVKCEAVIDECCESPEVQTKFKGINLEDDIEKVEVTSHDESSEEPETDCLVDYESPKSQFASPLFSGIPTQNPTESIKSWLQRITDAQHEIQKKHLAIQSSIPTVTGNSSINNSSTATNNAPSRIMKYQDLPYMGEITLDSSKSRRGRKPKKADICHLIYKNYGTILPGTPNPDSYLEKDNSILKRVAVLDSKEAVDSANRTDVQNKIISSLLEKRLTQEYKRTREGKRHSPKEKVDQNEPLNLCIRDLNHLKIRLLKNNDNTYSSAEIKSEPQSDEDVDLFQDTPSPSIIYPNELHPRPNLIDPSSARSSPDSSGVGAGSTTPKPAERTAPGGYVYWPNAGVFIHPLALQQQLLLYTRMTGGSDSYILPGGHSPRQPPHQGTSSTATSSSPKETQVELRKIVPKTVKSKASSSKDSTAEETDHSTGSPGCSSTQELKKRNAPSSSENGKAPTKRKRSAIFIPPIPTENNTNPATEVSICKFKFTGGAKPSLQEKKMLSVDSGGNFRYYSGTGDKSMRGYEFFPRETLQQQVHNSQGSSTGAFLQASGTGRPKAEEKKIKKKPATRKARANVQGKGLSHSNAAN